VSGVTAAPSFRTTHIVKKGDTLYAIAVEFGTTVAEIKAVNGLTSNSLKIGQKLNIP
jgi:LysM repeat protein